MRPSLAALHEALAFFLPDHVTPDELDVHSSRRFPSRIDASERQRSTATTRSFRFVAVPSRSGRPRALLPPEASKGIGLLQPRSEPFRPRVRVAQQLAGASPNCLWSLCGTEIRLTLSTYSRGLVALRAAFPGGHIGCYLGNAENQGRVTVQTFVEQGICGVAKFVSDAEGRIRMGREVEMLRSLGADARLSPWVPRLIDTPYSHLGTCIITDAFVGLPCPLAVTPALEEWLDRCIDSRKPVEARHARLVTELESRAMQAGLAKPYAQARKALGTTRVPSTVVHGDFAPWNLRIRDGVAYAYDWEYGHIDGIPTWDDFFFRTQVAVIANQAGPTELASLAQACVRRGSQYYSRDALVGLMHLVWIELAVRYGKRDDIHRARVMVEALGLPLGT